MKSYGLTGLAAAAAMAAATLGTPLSGANSLAPGDQRQWTLDFRAKLEQQGTQRPVEVDLTAELLSTISAVRSSEYDVALQLVDAHIVGEGVPNAPNPAKEQLERRLARPFWATYRDDGELLAIHFFKDATASDRNLLEMIATETQLVRPPEDRPVWTVLERDAAGEYLAIYSVAGTNAVVKRKLKYVHTAVSAGVPADALHVDVTRSELRFSLDPAGAIVKLDGSNAVRIGVAFGNAEPLAAITETHLSNPRSSRAPDLIGSLARALPNLMTSPIVTQQLDPEQTRADSDRRLVEGQTTESLLEAAIASTNDQMLPERLTALFRQRPEAAAAGLALLRRNAPQKRIVNALGAAGSPAAIEALDTLARDRSLPLALRIDALTAFISMQHPSVEAMRGPAALLDDADVQIASTARLVSGGLARAGRKEHPDEADRIDAALVARYHKAGDLRERFDLLAALGNSVGPSTLPVIENTLHDAHDPARLAAARALRLVSGPEVDGLLSRTITSDQDPGVRFAALFAASFHHPIGPVLGEALVQAARADPVEYVRSRAITLLRQNPDASPRIAESLVWIAGHDPKPGIRRLAQEALAHTPVQSAR
jgi:hypothetical protein